MAKSKARSEVSDTVRQIEYRLLHLILRGHMLTLRNLSPLIALTSIFCSLFFLPLAPTFAAPTTQSSLGSQSSSSNASNTSILSSSASSLSSSSSSSVSSCSCPSSDSSSSASSCAIQSVLTASAEGERLTLEYRREYETLLFQRGRPYLDPSAFDAELKRLQFVYEQRMADLALFPRATPTSRQCDCRSSSKTSSLRSLSSSSSSSSVAICPNHPPCCDTPGGPQFTVTCGPTICGTAGECDSSCHVTLTPEMFDECYGNQACSVQGCRGPGAADGSNGQCTRDWTFAQCLLQHEFRHMCEDKCKFACSNEIAGFTEQIKCLAALKAKYCQPPSNDCVWCTFYESNLKYLGEGLNYIKCLCQNVDRATGYLKPGTCGRCGSKDPQGQLCPAYCKVMGGGSCPPPPPPTPTPTPLPGC
jgi:hypothetical protein